MVSDGFSESFVNLFLISGISVSYSDQADCVGLIGVTLAWELW